MAPAACWIAYCLCALACVLRGVLGACTTPFTLDLGNGICVSPVQNAARISAAITACEGSPFNGQLLQGEDQITAVKNDMQAGTKIGETFLWVGMKDCDQSNDATNAKAGWSYIGCNPATNFYESWMTATPTAAQNYAKLHKTGG